MGVATVADGVAVVVVVVDVVVGVVGWEEEGTSLWMVVLAKVAA